MDFSTAVTLESLFLTLGGVLIPFSSEDMLQRCVCWTAAMHFKCTWQLFQLNLCTSYTCYTYCNFRLSCYTLCNKSFQVTRHFLNTFSKLRGCLPTEQGARTFLKKNPALSWGANLPSYVSVGENVS